MNEFIGVIEMRQNKIIKKMMPFAIEAVLILTLFICFAAPASAEYVCEIVGGDLYEDLGDALADISNQGGGTIQLLQDIDHESDIYIEDISVTFDVNGFILNVICREPDFTVWGNALEVNGGEVLLIDTSPSEDGEFNVISYAGYGSGVYVYNDGKVEVTSATGVECGVVAHDGATVTATGDVFGSRYGV